MSDMKPCCKHLIIWLTLKKAVSCEHATLLSILPRHEQILIGRYESKAPRSPFPLYNGVITVFY